MKRLLTVSLCLCLFSLSLAAQTKKSPMKKAAGPAPDAAFMQKIWDGWCNTLDPANVSQYYATGPHVFFDIAPLKYGSWDEYSAGVKQVLAGYKSAKCTVTEPMIHPHGDVVWATAVVKDEMTTKAGKVEMGAFRWTVVWENQDGKWLIVHEHVSQPIS